MINNPDDYLERNFQEQAADVLQKLGYTPISPEECYKQRGGQYNVLLKDILRAKLSELNVFEYGGTKYKFKPENIERAINELNVSIDDAGGLIKANEKIYDALLLGRDLPETVADGRTLSFNLRFIDWEHPEKNDYHVTREYYVSNEAGDSGAVPDLVLFVNGIPFGAIECKSPLEDEIQGVSQHIRNHGKDYIPQLFKFTQVLVATNKNSAVFATTGTPRKHWNIWKEQNTEWQEDILTRCVVDRIPTQQDKIIVSLYTPERLLQLTRYYIVFDANVKKIAMYQQYFAVENIIKTVKTDDMDTGGRQGGVIWHTQGSGKSLQMVMVAKYLLEQIPNSKVVIVTDRKELDRQIEQTFSHTRLKPARATSGRNLLDLINEGKADIVTAIINKFKAVENSKVRVENRDVFVLVDESHRTQYGSLAAKMRIVFPKGCYIGFTGTPLMKRDKTAARFGGKYIHKYTIKDGVDDHAIVPLIYEGRFIEQKVDETNIDLWFGQITRRLSDKQVEDLKSRWSQLKRLTSTDTRIQRIALDINTHYVNMLKGTELNAMLACNYKRDAVRYLECFDLFGDVTAAVIISAPDTRDGYEELEVTPDDKVLAFWKKMMNRYGNEEVYEESIKNQFIDGDIDILIVCGKLLTGFDTPRTQVMYIDKELKEHALLQAIARVNRLYEGKDYGLIMDYRGLISKLDDAMEIYSGSGLENFDDNDIKGAVVDVLSCVGRIRETYSQLLDVFGQLRNSTDTEAIEVYLADDEKRMGFYAALCEFGKALVLAINSERVFEALSKDELDRYNKTFAFYSKVRRSIKIRYAEIIDNAQYEPQMQKLLDTHLTVAGLKQITNPVDVLDRDELEKELVQLGGARAKADAIRSTMTKSVSEHYNEHPVFYESFSKRIKEVLDEYTSRVISEAEYYEKMKDILEKYRNGQSSMTFPEKIKGNVNAQAFYGVIGAALDGKTTDSMVSEASVDYLTDMSLTTAEIIGQHSYVDWETNTDIHKRIAQEIDDMFYEYEQKGLKVDYDTIDTVIENVKTVALRRSKRD